MRRGRMLGRVAVIGLLIAGTAVGCGDDKPSKKAAAPTTTAAATAPTGPQQYTVVVDGPSTLGAENFAFGTYFPKTLAVRPGDTVVFENRSSNDVHTVSFGVKSDRSDQPVLVKNGAANPAAFRPCFVDVPRPDMTCPAPPAAAPEYAGHGFWNTGVILPTAAPPEAGPKSATVKLAAGIAPGAYVVSCLLHRFMEGTLQVVATDAERATAATVAATADRELGAARAQVGGIQTPAHAPAGAASAVTAGWGDNLVNFNRFEPETVSIKTGETVMWRDASTWTPHTVSFQPPFKSEAEPGALLPVGAKSGSKFAGGVAHSGIFGPSPPLPTDSFSLTFTKAGKYPYLCLLHPGMAGTVEVS